MKNWTSGEATLYRYLVLKNNFPARKYCECTSLFLLFNVYFTLNLPGKILNKQIWISSRIFWDRMCPDSGKTSNPERLELLPPGSISGCGSHCDQKSQLFASGYLIGHSRLGGKSRGDSGGSLVSVKCSVGAFWLLHHFSYTVGWRASCILCGGREGKGASCTLCG